MTTHKERANDLAGHADVGEAAMTHALLAILERLEAMASPPTCTDPDRDEDSFGGHCCGLPSSDDADIDDWLTFARQNPSSGSVSAAIRIDLLGFARSLGSAGWVLRRTLNVKGGEVVVVLHDTWDEQGENGEDIVVHVYDPNENLTGEAMVSFRTADIAASMFLDNTALRDLWERRTP